MVREACPASIAWCLDVGMLVEVGPPLLWFRARRGAGQLWEAQRGLQSAKPLALGLVGRAGRSLHRVT